MCVLPDVGHQRVPVEFRLGVVGRGRWIQRIISLCTNTETQRRRRGRFRNVKEEKQKWSEDSSTHTSSFVTLVSMDVIQPARRGRWGSLLWYVWVKRTWKDEEQKNLLSLIWDVNEDDGWRTERSFYSPPGEHVHLSHSSLLCLQSDCCILKPFFSWFPDKSLDVMRSLVLTTDPSSVLCSVCVCGAGREDAFFERGCQETGCSLKKHIYSHRVIIFTTEPQRHHTTTSSLCSCQTRDGPVPTGSVEGTTWVRLCRSGHTLPDLCFFKGCSSADRERSVNNTRHTSKRLKQDQISDAMTPEMLLTLWHVNAVWVKVVHT